MDKASNKYSDTHNQTDGQTYRHKYIQTYTEMYELIADRFLDHRKYNSCCVSPKIVRIMKRPAWAWQSSGARRQLSEMTTRSMTEAVDTILNLMVSQG